jgi:hypothetical protein
MATRGTVLVPTLSTFHDLAERFADIFPVVLVEQAKRQLEEAMRTVETARRAGVTLALGYDSGPPGSSAQELLRLMEAGLSAWEGLRAATIGGAAALGRDDHPTGGDPDGGRARERVRLLALRRPCNTRRYARRLEGPLFRHLELETAPPIGHVSEGTPGAKIGGAP